MDPTEILLRRRNSMLEPPPKQEDIHPPSEYVADTNNNIDIIGNNQILTYDHAPIYVDLESYSKLINREKNYDRGALKEFNPFNGIGSSIFSSDVAVKAANIDAVYKLTGHIFGDIRRVNAEDCKIFRYADIASGPGSYTEYIQWRVQNARGWGMTLKGKNDWDRGRLNTRHFNIRYGDDQTGDIVTNWKGFAKSLVTENSGGVHLFMANGNVGDSNEITNQRLIFTESLTAILGTKRGGNAFIKLFDTVTEMSVQIIYMLALTFEKISIFKPISSSPFSPEKFIICWNRHYNKRVNPIVDMMVEVIGAYEGGGDVSSFYSKRLPEDFIEWIISINDHFTDLRFQASEILQQVNTSKPKSSDKIISRSPYDVYKAYAIWSIPGDKAEY